MNLIRNTFGPVLLATIWISLSEFFRNELLFKSYWTDHYQLLGFPFPSDPVNGIVWGLWSLVFALTIYLISRKFDLLHTTLICWIAGFILMWIAVGNLGVLPSGLLWFAVPLSLLETAVAAFIIMKLSSACDVTAVGKM
jgi:hypothetical protein